MSQSNTDRQRKWREKKRLLSFGGGPRRKELTMLRIFGYLLKHGDQTASELYRKLNANRDRETWKWLLGEIYHNGALGEDKLAPVTCRGTGRKGDPIVLRTSEEWDLDRNWDQEQDALRHDAEIAAKSVLRVPILRTSASEPKPTNADKIPEAF